MAARTSSAGALCAATAALLCLALLPSASTGSNTVTASRSGDGQSALATYIPSNIVYALNTTAPDNIDKVTLTLDAAPVAGSTISLQMRAGGPWYACSSSGTTLTCQTVSGGQATVTTTNALRLVGAD